MVILIEYYTAAEVLSDERADNGRPTMEHSADRKSIQIDSLIQCGGTLLD